MLSFFLPIAATIAALLMQLAIAALLLRAYYRTRNIGFIWLGIAIVIWPFLSRWIFFVAWRYYLHPHHQAISWDTSVQMIFGVGFLNPVYALQGLIGVALMLISVLLLSRGVHRRPVDD